MPILNSKCKFNDLYAYSCRCGMRPRDAIGISKRRLEVHDGPGSKDGFASWRVSIPFSRSTAALLLQGFQVRSWSRMFYHP